MEEISILTEISISGKTYKIKDNDTYDLFLDIKKYLDSGKLVTWAHYTENTEQSGQYVQVCFYDENKKGFIFSNNDEEWDPAYMKPIGIVVVPLSHDVYGDGTAGVMSLVNMSWLTPDEGDLNAANFSEGSLVMWGPDAGGLPTFNEYPILGNCNSAPTNNFTKVLSSNVFLPNDKWPTGYVCNTDMTTKYYDSNDASRGWLASPYLDVSKRNPLYYATSPSPATSKNPFSDFDGKGNTEQLISKNTKQTDWQTAETLDNSGTSGSYTAAACCWRYHTEHTNQGDWYLPAEGEIGYVVPRFAKIEKTLARLNEIFGNVTTTIEFDATQNYWSSTAGALSGANQAINRISTMNGTAGTRNSSQTSGARAFIKISPMK